MKPSTTRNREKKKSELQPLVLELLDRAATSGVNVPLEINGVVVGLIQWDTTAATNAILKALKWRGIESSGNPYQDALQAVLGWRDDQDNAGQFAALLIAARIGAELDLYGRLIQEHTSTAVDRAQAYYTRCRGCGCYFVPSRDRKRTERRGRRPEFHSSECQDAYSHRKLTIEERANRKERKAAKALGFVTVGKFREFLSNKRRVKKTEKELRHTDRARHAVLMAHLRRRFKQWNDQEDRKVPPETNAGKKPH